MALNGPRTLQTKDESTSYDREQRPLANIPFFEPGDIQEVCLEDGIQDVPFHVYSDHDIIYEQPQVRAKIVGGKYLKGELLGEGAYSKVKEMLDCQLLCRRAVKIMKQKRLKRIPNGEQNVRREIQILRKLNHNNVIKLIEVMEDEEKQKLYIVLEHCQGGLQELLEKCKDNKLPLWQAQNYFVQLIDGLEYLHSRGIVHKDIKPGNLLVTTDGTVKLTDFGVAEELDIFTRSDDCTNCQGSPAFQPPEIAAGQDTWSGFMADIWAAGVTLYQFTTGKLPFEGETIYKLFSNVMTEPLEVPQDLPEPLKDLIRGMLEKDPERRMSIAEIKQHTWYNQVQERLPLAELAQFPPYFGSEDPYRPTTVLRYLEAYYNFQQSSNAPPQTDGRTVAEFQEEVSTEVLRNNMSADRPVFSEEAELEYIQQIHSQPDPGLQLKAPQHEVIHRHLSDNVVTASASDTQMTDNMQHISRRVSAVSSQEEVLFPSPQEPEHSHASVRKKERKKSHMSKKASTSCQQQ